ncbi:hypothetical protein KL928_002211 [Ogataea angusta]|uniref:Uncharacterized protein n=1 Tax=Pichia angusta TaxID=870730 RepID=A0AAN6DH73_PICAN|nr:uncharacterized protein KL928_002211 [Ogataea angusta]KAG7819537.1 hypothetical protein KL928_002211 [Ogataea angusta]
MTNRENCSAVKQLDRVHRGHGPDFSGLDRHLNSEVAKVHTRSQGGEGDVNLGQVGQVVSSECIVDGQTKRLVFDVSNQLDQGTVGLKASGGEGSGESKERGDELGGRRNSDDCQNSRAETVTLIQKLHQKGRDERHERQLDNVGQLAPNRQGCLRGELVDGVKVAGKREQDGVDQGDQHRGQFLPGLEKLSIGSGFEVDFDDFEARKNLPQETGRDDGQQPELQRRSGLGRKWDPQPAKGVGYAVLRHVTQWKAGKQVHSDRGDGVNDFLIELDFLVRILDFRQKRDKRFSKVQ